MDLNETQNQANCFVKMKHKSNSKSNFMKKLMPRSGSYDINNNNEINNANYDHSPNISDNQVDSSLPNSKRIFRSSQSIMKLFTDNRTEKDYDSELYETCRQRRRSFYKFQKKWTLMGMPLLYLTYFSAIHTFLAYGATSLVSIYYIISNLATILIPLYILVVGYLAITLISFLLILAIKNERLNMITLWLVIVSVFILPEIGLNIILVEATKIWSYNEYKAIIISLTVRILLDLPCIGFVLSYHVNKIKRNNYLQDMLQPLKNNIVNGEVLKIYNNIKVDTFDEPNHVIQVSNQRLNQLENEYNNNNNDKIKPYNNSNHNTLNKIRPNTYIYKFNKNHSIILRPSTAFQPAKNSHQDHFNDEEALLNESKYDKNALHLIWDKDEQEYQANQPLINQKSDTSFEEEHEILIHHLEPYASNKNDESVELKISIENHKRDSLPITQLPVLNKSNSTSSLEKILPGEIKSNPIYESSQNESDSRLTTSLLKRSLSLNCQRNGQKDINIPIEYEGPVIKLSIKNDAPVSFQHYPQIEEVTEQYMAFKNLSSNNKNKTINLSNHHIYLPPAPSIPSQPEQNSTLIEKTINNSDDNTNTSTDKECKCAISENESCSCKKEIIITKTEYNV